MSRTTWKYPVETVHGALKRKGDTVSRQKTFRNSKGQIIRQGPSETYLYKARNYKANPAKGAEKANLDLNQRAWKQAAEEFKNPERAAYWQLRFDEQSFSPDPEAPIDKKTGKPKIYAQVRPFARAMIRQQLLKQIVQ